MHVSGRRVMWESQQRALSPPSFARFGGGTKRRGLGGAPRLAESGGKAIERSDKTLEEMHKARQIKKSQE